MESIGDAGSFLSAAREVIFTKPIIVIKAGRTEAAAAAAASHTGALTGSDEVLDAAFRRSGVLRVSSIDDLFNMAEVLAKAPRPKGKRLTILTNAGGPGVLATDALISEGGELAPLSPETKEELNQLLPPHWSHGNPIDVLGDADPERYAKACAIALNDPNSDGILAILTPQSMTDPTQTAKQVVEMLQGSSIPVKPILASWMGGAEIAAGEAIFNNAKIFTLPFPDTAARVFNYMWRYAYNLRGIYETPILPGETDEDAPDRAKAREIIQTAQESGRTLLTEFESKQLLAAYKIPTVETHIATSVTEAVQLAGNMGYPVVLNQYVSNWTMKDGTQVRIRPIRPEDEPLAVKFHESLSEESIYFRYFHLIKLQTRVAHERLSRLCFIDYDREMALVVIHKDSETGDRNMLAVARLSKLHGKDEVEFSMIISDRFQCQGLGTELLRRLLQVDKDEKLQYITAEILSENRAMQHVCQKLGFRIEPMPGEAMVKVVYEIG